VTVGKNALSGVLAKVAQVGTRLLTIPVVIAHLGLGGYGIWSIIMTIAAYMRFGTLGVKSAFQKYVAEATGTGDYDKANRLLTTGCVMMLVISIAGLIPIAIFSEQLVSLAAVPAEFASSAASAISVLALIMVMSNAGAVFEAIVMGGHRIDIARNLIAAFTVVEAVAILALLKLGYGLFAMAAVMAASELGLVTCCWFASKKIVTQISIHRRYITRAVIPELIRFAGSYQAVNVLEILYAAILPITALREFGAEVSGVYAITTRMVTTALTLPEAFLLPILSGGTLIYASGSVERMQSLITKSFKVTLGLSLFPLAFMSMFGSTMAFVWTGQREPSFAATLPLVCVAGLFQSISMLQLVLYRVSGKALMDNIRQVLRIITLVSIVYLAGRLGLYGVLSGLAVAELVGMIYMLFAITNAFPRFNVRLLLPDALKLTAATACIVMAGVVSLYAPVPAASEPRTAAIFQLALVSLTCLAAAWPALRLTACFSDAEWRALSLVLVPRRLRFN
jgi:O-antigen/teichoic acid export membrane protein